MEIRSVMLDPVSRLSGVTALVCPCSRCGREMQIGNGTNCADACCEQCSMTADESFYCECLAVVSADERPTACMTVLLGVMKVAQKAIHGAHWRASGESSYGDHTLLQRLYELYSDEIDDVGEKAVFLGEESVCNVLLVTYIEVLLAGRALGISTDMSACIFYESVVVDTLDRVWDTLVDNEMFTEGIGNMLAQFRDTHETSLYLLKRRTNVLR